jgi:hypothetical protein
MSEIASLLENPTGFEFIRVESFSTGSAYLDSLLVSRLPPPGTADLDGDGLTNFEDFDFGANPSKWDSDGDGLSDGQEIQLGLNPKGTNLIPGGYTIHVAPADSVYPAFYIIDTAGQPYAVSSESGGGLEVYDIVKSDETEN